MKIGIVGAGLAGLTAAYDLTRAGHDVTVWEAEAQPGGLASGFRDERWTWPVDRFYRHIFGTDKIIQRLSREIGAEYTFRDVETVICYGDTIEPFDSPLAVLRFSHLNLVDKLRAGATVAYLRLLRQWQPLEQAPAAGWLRRTMGPQAYRVLWEPLLVGKFGADEYDKVNMAWFWARISTRTKALGYYTGGFQALADRLVETIRRLGGEVRLGEPVQQVRRAGEGFTVLSPAGQTARERVILTVGPQVALRIAPDLPADYAAQLRNLRSLAAMTLVLALDRPLTHGNYWLNLDKKVFPFLALVEHTNFQDREHYAGETIVYLGDYLPETHPNYRMSQEELLALYLPAVRRFNPEFDPSWIRKSWLFRQTEAQPLAGPGHSRNIPPLATGLPGLYMASMSQVYPWDRGTNFAVEIGHRVAQLAAQP